MKKLRRSYYLRPKVNMDGYLVRYIDSTTKLKLSSDFWDHL